MKRALSKNLLRMKFMQRTAMEAEKEQSLADRVITSEEWRYEPHLLSGLPHPPPLRGVVSRPDYLPVPCGAGRGLGPAPPLQPAAWGRVSYGGFNPAVEKLMAECGRGEGGGAGADSALLEAEAGATVSAEQLQRKKKLQSGGGLTTSLAKKFDAKRARKRRMGEAEDEAAEDAAGRGGGGSSPEEGELDDNAAAESQRQPHKKQRRKLRKAQQQQQQQQQQQAKKMKKKKLGQAVLPHPSTLLAGVGRKRKAEPHPPE